MKKILWDEICPVCEKAMATGNKYCSLKCYNERDENATGKQKTK